MSDPPPMAPEDARRRTAKRRQPFRAGGAPRRELDGLAGKSMRVFSLRDDAGRSKEPRRYLSPPAELRHVVERCRRVERGRADRRQRRDGGTEVQAEPHLLTGLGEDVGVEGLRRWIRGAARRECRRILDTVSYTHLRAHETVLDLVCR